MIKSKFSLDLTKGGIQKTLYAKSGEIDGRVAVITLTEAGKVFDASPYSLRVCLDSGESISNKVTYEQGCVRFVFPAGMLTSPGEKICELKISNDKHTIYSPMFKVVVEQSLGQQITEDIPFDEPIKYQESIPSLDKGGDVTLEDEVALYSNEKTTRNKLSALPFETKFANRETLDSLSKDGDKLLFDGKPVTPKSVSELDNDAGYVAQWEFDQYLQEQADMYGLVNANTDARHTHANKEDVLDKLSVSNKGDLLFNNKPVASESGTVQPDGGSSAVNPKTMAAQTVAVLLEGSTTIQNGLVNVSVESVDVANSLDSHFQEMVGALTFSAGFGGDVLVYTPPEAGTINFTDPNNGNEISVNVVPGTIYIFYAFFDDEGNTFIKYETPYGTGIRALLLNGVDL